MEKHYMKEQELWKHLIEEKKFAAETVRQKNSCMKRTLIFRNWQN